MKQEIKNILAGFSGSDDSALISINRKILDYLANEDVQIKGEGIGNGGKRVTLKDLRAAVSGFKPEPEEVVIPPKEDDFDKMPFLQDAARNGLQAAGLTTLEQIKAFMDNGEDLTTVKGIGDGTANKIIDLLTE